MPGCVRRAYDHLFQREGALVAVLDLNAELARLTQFARTPTSPDTDRRKGLWVYYGLSEQADPVVRGVLGAVGRGLDYVRAKCCAEAECCEGEIDE